MTALQLTTQTPSVNYSAFRATLTDLFRARVVSVQRHTAKIVELKVRAPLAARSFQAGQFYRIQNYETLTLKHDNTRLQTEALALIGIVRPTEPDVIAFMVSERGVSSRLVANFMAGQPISVMGPTGARSKIPSNQTVMILGNELAVAHLLSVGRALKQAGNQIIFIGCFTADETIFCEFEVRELADVVHYGSQLAELVRKLANDSTIRSINRVNIIGSSRLIREWQTEGYQALQSKLTDDYEAFAAVYGPMQCMLKGVCAQCLQWQIDPVTLQRKKAVYACSWQNQPLTRVDINNIDERLEQNRLQEILAAAWLDYLQSIGGPECSSS